MTALVLVFALVIEAIWLDAIRKSIEKAHRKGKSHSYVELVAVSIITLVTIGFTIKSLM